MKVGDLVELSAYGANRKYNENVYHNGDTIGLVTHSRGWCYTVKWVSSGISFGAYMRKELKYAVARKNT